MADLKFIGICGSLRKESRNMGLLRKARDIMPAGSALEIADIADFPFFNADLATRPQCVESLVRQVAAADGLLLACPEYNYSLAPALKNALDWLSRDTQTRPLYGKTGAIIGAGGGMGTSRAQYHLRQVCVYLNLLLIDSPEFFSNAFSPAYAENGDLVDPELEKKLASVLKALCDWTKVLQKGRE